MNKVHQTVVDDKKGNCMQAVLATLFGKKLEETVNPVEFDVHTWFPELLKWVQSNGFDYLGVVGPHADKSKTLNALNSVYAINGLLFAVVPSKNFENVTHAVVVSRSGEVVHDPNPDSKWLGTNVVESGDLEYFYHFSPIDGFIYGE